jgi:hypothetical protein
MRFLLGTSVFDGGKQERRDMTVLWERNNRLMDMKPTRTVVISEGNSRVPSMGFATDVVRLTGDLGHVHQHIDNGPKSHHAFTGWSASMLALAMLAYVDEADFIYKESDCLAFGPWVWKIYSDLGNADWVFGPKMTAAPWMACAQSLFLVRHRFIPAFVRLFLSFGPEDDRSRIGETRFVEMARKMPREETAYLSFGVDRMRPIPWGAPVWYCQQWTAEELAEARRRNIIT